MTNYASLQDNTDFYEQFGIPHQHVSEPTRSQWNHIDDLDSFFTRVYKYHQKHGFTCMALKEIVNLHQFVFISGLTLSLMYAIDYSILFSKKEDPSHNRSIFNVLRPFHEVMSTLPFFGWFLIFFLGFFLVLTLIRQFYALVMYWDIKQFYNQALKIDDNDLDNMTWHDVQKRLMQVQLELQMCIHKRELTELDIYHRILRQTNYLVALVNKKLLPPRTCVPVLGDVVYWTKGLRLNILFLLFWSPWSPFENPWHLREEYKRPGYREKMARQLGRQVLWLFLLNVISSPLVLIGQIIFYFFNYFELVRREPGKFGVRYWSHYGQLYIRHFNELDHELHARLTRAYKPATKYLGSFSSPGMVIVAGHISFMCSSILAIFICLSFLDNEVLYWDQVLSILAVLTGVISLCRNLQPDETQIWCPEALLQAVVLHTHYLPGDWQGLAHTSGVRAIFQQLFQYRFAAIFEEFLSPILTPFFLIRYIYPRTLDIVDFFRNFTVSVVGVGDVCSFAQMDVRKHGNPDWQADEEAGDFLPQTDQYTQAEDGKVELSLMHFTATNPDWQPPDDVKEFVANVNQESNKAHEYDPFGPYGVISSMELGLLDPDIRSIPPMFEPFRVSSQSDFARRASLDFRRTSLDFRRTSPYGGSPGPSIYRPRESLNLGSPSSTGLIRAPSMLNWKAEGADVYSSLQNMGASTVVLLNRRARRQSVRIARSAEETTPLLSNTNLNNAR